MTSCESARLHREVWHLICSLLFMRCRHRFVNRCMYHSDSLFRRHLSACNRPFNETDDTE